MPEATELNGVRPKWRVQIVERVIILAAFKGQRGHVRPILTKVLAPHSTPTLASEELSGALEASKHIHGSSDGSSPPHQGVSNQINVVVRLLAAVVIDSTP